MADYQETSVAGTMWRRAKMINIWNPLDGAPRVCFTEEDVVKLADGKVITSGDSTFINANYEAAKSFNIIDPITGQPTGQAMTQEQLYGLVYSLYRSLALERDTPKVFPQPDVPPLPITLP